MKTIKELNEMLKMELEVANAKAKRELEILLEITLLKIKL